MRAVANAWSVEIKTRRGWKGGTLYNYGVTGKGPGAYLAPAKPNYPVPALNLLVDIDDTVVSIWNFKSCNEEEEPEYVIGWTSF